jgi:hypothetical protein
MVIPKRKRLRSGVGGWSVSCLLICGVIARAEGFRLESVGARGGVSSNSEGDEFHQAQAFANWNMPWAWDLGKEWRLQSQLDFTAGWLGDRGHNAAIGTAGPGLLLSRERLPLSLDGGVSPTALSRSEFDSKDLGMDFQFTTHVGLNWDFARHWRLSYRFEHISNAGLASPNPGLNIHMLGLSYVF